MKQELARGTEIAVDTDRVYTSLYRPFFKQLSYFAKELSETPIEASDDRYLSDKANFTVITVRGNPSPISMVSTHEELPAGASST